MRSRNLFWWVLFVVAVAPAFGGVELVLLDGRVLSGEEVSRSDGEYVLVLDSGDEIALPVELVKGLRLTGEAEQPARGVTTGGEAEDLTGGRRPEGPTGLRETEPETLAGAGPRVPSPTEQREALGPPARFRKDIVDSRWEPGSDWEMDPGRNNNFRPSTWSKGPIDPTWEPKSAWEADKDVLKPSRSSWRKNIIDSTWTPTDGFR